MPPGLESFSKAQIAASLQAADVKSLRTVYLVMVFSVILLLAAVWFQAVHHTDMNRTPGWFSIFQGMMLVFMVGLYGIAVWGPKRWLTPERLHHLLHGAAQKHKDDENAVLEMLSLTARMVLVLRVSVLEAAALLGCVVMFVAAHFDLLHRNSLLWLNAVPAIILFLFVAIRFPSRERIAAFISSHIWNRL